MMGGAWLRALLQVRKMRCGRLCNMGWGSIRRSLRPILSYKPSVERNRFGVSFSDRSIADRAVFIFDEAHEAGGVSKANSWTTSGPANRADFVRELVDLSAGSIFLSATSIKNPAVVDLYARRSDARYAVERISNLETILKDGGVPLQQMFATKFVASGQMVRRGRSMTGISFDANVVSVDRNVAEGISSIMRAINLFDEAKQQGLKEFDKELKREAKALAIDNAVGQAGAKSINFTSLMHNAIDQSLLAQKAEATVQEAISAIQRGEKPIIAVASTMNAFIDWYVKENGIKTGDPINLTFGDVLYRYLERSRNVMVKDHEGKQTRQRLTDDELGVVGVMAYQEALDLIEETDLSDIPLSSIDYIKWRLTQEGYKVDEITGRKNIIEYSQMGLTAYGLRPSRELSPQGKINIVNRFNAGDLDVVILNKSGATGISLHSSERFNDQRPRHMIVAQAERDVNQVMQMLGRANRFGQVNKPRFTLLMSDLPAEKRLGAILAKKAARESDLSISNVVDFMNVYGEEVVLDILQEDFELQAKLGYPLNSSGDDSDTTIINRVTGRIPLLIIQEQEELYNLIESETIDLIAQKEAMGESVLRADQLDLDARTIARMEVIPDESGVESEFTGPVCLEIVDAKVPIKPMTQLQVVNAVRDSLGLEALQDIAQHGFDAVGAIAQQKAQEIFQDVQQATEAYRIQAAQNVKSDVGLDKLNARLDEQLFHLQKTLMDTAPGTAVRVVSPEGNIFYGVVSRISQKGHNGSPAAPTNWKAQILIDHRSRQLTIPLSKFNRGTDETVTSITPQETNWSGEDIYEAFDIRQTQNQRSELQIFTGNPIKAYERFPKGKFVNYTNDRGEILQGLVMPVSFDIQEVLRDEPVVFHEPRQVKAFLTDVTQYMGAVKTLDELLTIKTQAGARFGDRNASGFVLQTVKSGAGDKYSVDADIIAAAGAEFYSVSDRMECIVPADKIDDVLQVIMQDKHWSLAAFDFKDQARNFLGVNLPQFQEVQTTLTDTVEHFEKVDIKALADQVRDQDLVSVAKRLGLEPDRHDKHKWRDDNHIISITGEKFHDWAVDQGGGGAIDLVMHVKECDFKMAVEWLSGQSPPKQSSPKQSQSRILQLPESSEDHWPAVRQYLMETRGLPADWVDSLHEHQLVYADQHQNAVFVRYQAEQSGQAWIRGDATGACLRGTQGEVFHGLSPGSERQAGYFWLRRGKAEVNRVILVESPIDAISLAVLERKKLSEQEATVYLSTDGCGAIPAEALKELLAKGGQVLVAFDADGAGEKLAWQVAEALPGVRRMVPAIGKDWNDRLLAEQQPDRVVPGQGDRQTFKALWKWYRVAGEVGHQEAYLKRITEVAAEVVDGKGLSEKAAEAMAKDLQGLEKSSQPVVVPAAVVPIKVATAVARGSEAGM
jgi:5S rRNA maturation endonuclease (ribonuclease M5)